MCTIVHQAAGAPDCDYMFRLVNGHIKVNSIFNLQSKQLKYHVLTHEILN